MIGRVVNLGRAGLFFALAACPVAAEPVTLSTLDGSFSITGEIKSFDGQRYTVSTALGDVTVEAAAVACEGAACPSLGVAGGSFGVAGEEELVAGLVSGLLARFAAAQGGAVQEAGGEGGATILRSAGGSLPFEARLTATTSAGAIDALFKGEADLAVSARPILPQEREAFAGFGLGDPGEPSFSSVIGRDAVVAIVNPANPVRSLSTGELSRVLAGEITDWSALGGPQAPIVVYRREQPSDAEEVVRTVLLAPDGLDFAGAEMRETDEAVVEAVLSDPNGLAVSTLRGSGGARALGAETGCGGSISPTPFNVSSGRYPLVQEIFLYSTNRELAAAASAFRDFLPSPDAQAEVSAAGLVGGLSASAGLAEQGDRVVAGLLGAGTPSDFTALRSMVETLREARQLPVVIRFVAGTADLTAASEAIIAQVAASLSGPGFEGADLIVAGFVPPTGDPAAEGAASLALAQAALGALRAADAAPAETFSVETAGYGALLPLSCGTDDPELNRRVELWLREPD